MRTFVPRVLSLLTFVAALGLAPAGAAVSEEEVRSWQEELAAIDQALRAGEWASAESAAGALVATMAESEPGPQLANLVSVAVLSQALAEAGSGSTEDALWHWIGAQNLNPRLRRARFPAYGTAGAYLEEHRLREVGEPPPGLAPTALGPGVAPPARPGKEAVPKAWARFEVVVDEGGAVHAPVLVTPAQPATVLASLEALRALELQPAEAGGEPVAVFWRPRPALWLFHRTSGPMTGGIELRGADEGSPLEAALAECTALGAVMESSGVGVGPGTVDVLKTKARRKGADVLSVDTYDRYGVKGRAFRCGADWYPPDLQVPAANYQHGLRGRCSDRRQYEQGDEARRAAPGRGSR